MFNIPKIKLYYPIIIRPIFLVLLTIDKPLVILVRTLFLINLKMVLLEIEEKVEEEVMLSVN